MSRKSEHARMHAKQLLINYLCYIPGNTNSDNIAEVQDIVDQIITCAVELAIEEVKESLYIDDSGEARWKEDYYD